MALTCLDTIIGLDTAECACFEDAPEGFDTSGSGYYLTDPEHGVPMRDGILAAKDCSQTEYWDVLSRARSEAIRDWKVDMRAALDAHKQGASPAWRGTVGLQDRLGYQAVNTVYAGQLWKPKTRKPHQKFVVTAIHVGSFDTTGTLNITVRSNAQGWTNVVQTCNVVAGTYTRTALTTPLTLQFYDIAVNDLYYAFTYDPTGFKPLQNRLWCCGGGTWSKFMRAGGLAVNTLDNLEDVDVAGSDGLGLLFEGYIDCDHLDWVCELAQLNNTQMFNVVALSILYKASAKLLLQLHRSGKINQYTLLDQAQADMRIADLQAKYHELNAWVARSLPVGASGCYGCNKNDFTVSKRFS